MMTPSKALPSAWACARAASAAMPALPDELVVFNDHRAHRRVGAGQAKAVPRQPQGLFHPALVLCARGFHLAGVLHIQQRAHESGCIKWDEVVRAFAEAGE